MGFPKQEYWSGFPFPSPGDLPDPSIELGFPALQLDSLWTEPPGKPMPPLRVITSIFLFLLGGIDYQQVLLPHQSHQTIEHAVS